MQATSQNNSHNIPICYHQDQTASIVTRIEGSIIMSIVISQSIMTQFYNNGTIVIKQSIVQLIRLQSSSFNALVTSTFRINREQRKYILLIFEAIEFMLVSQSGRIIGS
jgi:hypothetical protein